ncbi:MAG: bile acid:sodium symporter family protein, partial [Planctomycetota bacterium]
EAAREGKAKAVFAQLEAAGQAAGWEEAEPRELFGNLRRLEDSNLGERLYLLRTREGEIHVLVLPEDSAQLAKTADSPYANLAEQVKFKMTFPVLVTSGRVNGVSYSFCRLTAAPTRPLLDRLFFVAIIAMLALVMIGMGTTLKLADFRQVLVQPRAMLIGPLLQFGLLPLLAMTLGILVGYREEFPFIFCGLILIASSPGGVTSNLMTYFGKGDLALSVSMTAVSTVLSLVFTPLLLVAYATSVPEVSIPVADIAKSILVLVLVPLVIGMTIRARAAAFAIRAEKFFSALGIFALLFLIVTGVLNNLELFSDFERYGPRFYGVIFTLSLSSMVLSIGIGKLLRVANVQIRAIALETGLQNAALAMTIAILLQDRMGDFYASMFAVSGLYGLWMYVSGTLIVLSFPFLLPLRTEANPA